MFPMCLVGIFGLVFFGGGGLLRVFAGWALFLFLSGFVF